MRIVMRWLHKYWEAKKQKKESITQILNNFNLSIRLKRDTSIVLACIGADPIRKKGERQLLWKNVLIFTESKNKRYRHFLKDILDQAKKEGKTYDQVLDGLSDIARKTKLRKDALNDFINQISRSNLNELIEHIFDGHLRSTRIGRGARSTRVPSTKGIHSEDLLDGIKNRIGPGSRRPPNPIDDEAYIAHVQMKDPNGNWIDKYSGGGNIIDTTMFPKNWSKQRILEEIAFAFKNKVQDLTSNVHFNGKSTNGTKIVFVVVNNVIKTVYPKI